MTDWVSVDNTARDSGRGLVHMDVHRRLIVGCRLLTMHPVGVRPGKGNASPKTVTITLLSNVSVRCVSYSAAMNVIPT